VPLGDFRVNLKHIFVIYFNRIVLKKGKYIFLVKKSKCEKIISGFQIFFASLDVCLHSVAFLAEGLKKNFFLLTKIGMKHPGN